MRENVSVVAEKSGALLVKTSIMTMEVKDITETLICFRNKDNAFIEPP